YMAASQLGSLPQRLIAHGRAPHTPFALIENGTRADQRTLTGRLDQLSALARRHRIAAPALLIIGEVAALATDLAWSGRCIHGGEALAPAACLIPLLTPITANKRGITHESATRTNRSRLHPGLHPGPD